jgi:hypothetical protein
MTILHFHSPEILYVTVLGNLLVFTILGLFFGTLGIGLEQGTSYALVFFILLWTLFHGWSRELDASAPQVSLWIATAIFAWALSFYSARHTVKARHSTGMFCMRLWISLVGGTTCSGKVTPDFR